MASFAFRTLAAFVLALLVSLPGTLSAQVDKNKDFHAIHMMLNNGLNMILDGSSLIMMSEMDIDITFAKDPQAHGSLMIATGRKLIDRAIKGPVMVDMHVQKIGLGPMMEATHALGELMLKTAYTQEAMQPVPAHSEVAKNLHIIHLEANHALMMACQGSNMFMIGQGDRSNDLIRYSFEQGREMMLTARTVLHDLLASPQLKKLESSKLSPEDTKLLAFTKEHLLNSVDIANILVRMELE